MAKQLDEITLDVIEYLEEATDLIQTSLKKNKHDLNDCHCEGCVWLAGALDALSNIDTLRKELNEKYR